jgi:hypothetical protein
VGHQKTCYNKPLKKMGVNNKMFIYTKSFSK